MKKLILVTVACVCIASPVLGNEFNNAQKEMLNKIASNMMKYKDDAQKMDLLTQKRTCAVKATDMETLKACQTKFPPEQLQALIK